MHQLASDGANAVSRAIADVVRLDSGRILSSLVGELRDFQLAEDSFQDALESALVHWQRSGLPSSPAGWLKRVARRKAIDRLRRVQNFNRKTPQISHLIETLAEQDVEEEQDHFGDERLKLIFTCCHPALERKTSVALTLRSICGLTTEEVADAFVDTVDAMAQRLVRARHKIAKAGIAYKVPARAQWQERLESVLAVIYLMFNEGYASSSENLVRADLCEEAIRLARLLDDLCPEQAELEGLIALMLLHHSRRNARLGDGGKLLTLEEQDRSLWLRPQVEEGSLLVERALGRGIPGPFQIQAAIAALHANADHFGETDWKQIVLLYDLLGKLAPNPIHDLNRIVALSFSADAVTALRQLEPLGRVLANYQPFHAAHADLLARVGQREPALVAYRLAIALSQSDAEKRFLQERLRLCQGTEAI